jgi:hypothetical protein
MADLTTSAFSAAWNSIAFQRLRAAHLTGDVAGTACEKCAAYG